MSAVHHEWCGFHVCLSSHGSLAVYTAAEHGGEQVGSVPLRDIIGPPDLDTMAEYSFEKLESPETERLVTVWMAENIRETDR